MDSWSCVRARVGFLAHDRLRLHRLGSDGPVVLLVWRKRRHGRVDALFGLCFLPVVVRFPPSRAHVHRAGSRRRATSWCLFATLSSSPTCCGFVRAEFGGTKAARVSSGVADAR